MTKDWTLALIFIGSAFLVGVISTKRCSSSKDTKIVFKDTTTNKLREKNAEIDNLSRELFNEYEKNDTKLSRLKDSIKNIVAKYHIRYKTLTETKYISDTAILTLLKDANDYIIVQDSLIAVYDTTLINRNEAIELLKEQVELNKNAALKRQDDDCCVEVARYKHVVFRLYKRRR